MIRKLWKENKPKSTKNVTFCKAGDQKFLGIKLPVNQRKFRTFDSLLDELTGKLPGFSYGVRSLTTARGKHTVTKIDDLNHGAMYLCSEKRQTKKTKKKRHRLPGKLAQNYESENATSHPDKVTQDQFSGNKKQKNKSRKNLQQHVQAKTTKDYLHENSEVHLRQSENWKTNGKPPQTRSLSQNNLKRSESYEKVGRPAIKRNHSHEQVLKGTKRTQRRLSLSPLDNRKLKHVQRINVANHTVDREDYTLPALPNSLSEEHTEKQSTTSYESQEEYSRQSTLSVAISVATLPKDHTEKQSTTTSYESQEEYSRHSTLSVAVSEALSLEFSKFPKNGRETALSREML